MCLCDCICISGSGPRSVELIRVMSKMLTVFLINSQSLSLSFLSLLSETASVQPGQNDIQYFALCLLFLCLCSLSVSPSLPLSWAKITANTPVDREEASRTYARWMTGSRQAPPPTDDFAGPLGKGVPSATAELRTYVAVGPPRPSSITHPEAAGSGARAARAAYHSHRHEHEARKVPGALFLFEYSSDCDRQHIVG